MRGPIDYIVVGFEGNKFDGSILNALGEAIDNGVIALVALGFVMKDASGGVAALSVTEVDNAEVKAFTEKYPSNNELISEDDVAEIGEQLDNNTAAGFLVVEQLWAKPLKKALIDANGVLIAEGRIHPEALAEIEEGDK